jgi:hypothetical protein
MAVASIIWTLFLFILAFVISALPLYLAVKLLGGKTTILNTIFVNLISGLAVFAVNYFFKAGVAIVAFIIVIWIYHEFFRLKWIKAFVAWLLQFVFIAIFYLMGIALFGITAAISFL